MNAGDVVACYQTEERRIVGFCLVTKMTGRSGDRKIYLQPIEYLERPLLIHRAKRGTLLAQSAAVNGPVMVRELDLPEMEELIRLAKAPKRVMHG